ncbi:MAG TPA: S8 family serine peptidase [Bacteroidales bacterium]|nr:S8 family serine peptidase [Bacteroidales bacterium]
MRSLYTCGLGLLVALGVSVNTTFGQNNTEGKDKKTITQQNWHHLDPKKNKYVGISTDKAYNNLLKDKKMTRVVVAVLDGGVDINHEDLKGRIWVNPKEIPGNGIDDDNNGFIDDINGWNFIGNASGANLNQTTLELTRQYKLLSEKYKQVNPIALKGEDLAEYNNYLKIKAEFNTKYEKAKKTYDLFQNFAANYIFCDSILSSVLKKKDYTIEDVQALKVEGNDQMNDIKKYMITVLKKGINRQEFTDYKEYLESQVKYKYNLDFNPRAEIMGDNLETFDKYYGNNNVIGPDPEHGTFVSGVIAAVRNNGLGVNGIADSVKIMVVRVIPDGDEYDKDVANAIIYAANNGADIINCSFGKSYSPQKQFVDEALQYAQSKGVLIVHAAGNDAENNDSIVHYPANLDTFGNTLINNWLTIGASSAKADKTLAASFSNYGEKSVDLFAPGSRIYSTKPFNKYGTMDGTSFSAPMVAGAAALVKSAYPSLTASQLKEILLKSVVRYPKLKVLKPIKEEGKKPEKIKFSELSSTAGVLNVYEALKLAEKYAVK